MHKGIQNDFRYNVFQITYSPSVGYPPSPYNVSTITDFLLQNLLNDTLYSISLFAFTTGGCGPNITGIAKTYPGNMMVFID